MHRGLPRTRSFLAHAGLPHYSHQHRLWPTIRGESHAAHTLSIVLLNFKSPECCSGNVLRAKFLLGEAASGGQTVCRPAAKDCVWSLTLTSDKQKQFTAPAGVTKTPATIK